MIGLKLHLIDVASSILWMQQLVCEDCSTKHDLRTLQVRHIFTYTCDRSGDKRVLSVGPERWIIAPTQESVLCKRETLDNFMHKTLHQEITCGIYVRITWWRNAAYQISDLKHFLKSGPKTFVSQISLGGKGGQSSSLHNWDWFTSNHILCEEWNVQRIFYLVSITNSWSSYILPKIRLVFTKTVLLQS